MTDREVTLAELHDDQEPPRGGQEKRPKTRLRRARATSSADQWRQEVWRAASPTAERRQKPIKEVSTP